ncbi:hypothetical protein [Oceanithermus sp.]
MWLLGLVAVLSVAPARGAEDGYVFIGVEAGPAGPVYFGFAGSLGGEARGLEYRLEGRLRLGNVAVADGVAWAGWRPVASLDLRAGYDAWFLDAGATGRSEGGHAEWSLAPGLALMAACDVWKGVFGIGGRFREDPLSLQLWARNVDWLAALELGGGNFSLSGWYQAGYNSFLPKQYGIGVGWRERPYLLAAGYSSYRGFFAAGAYRPGRFSFEFDGHWYPQRSAALSGRVVANVAGGAGVALAGGYSLLPAGAYHASIEARLPLR